MENEQEGNGDQTEASSARLPALAWKCPWHTLGLSCPVAREARLVT